MAKFLNYATQLAKQSRVIVLGATLTLGGCSTLPDWMNPVTWFEDEEELEIKRLDPINAKFTPTLRWDENIGSGVKYYFSRLQPAVAYGKVFAASRQGEVAAFDKDTGKELWKFNLAEFRDEGVFKSVSQLWSDGISARISGGIVASYQSIFFGTENGVVFAVDAETGEIKWQADVRGEVLAKPAVDEGLVLVNTGSGFMHALDADTGEEQWSYESEVPALSLRGIAAPTISNGGAIVGTASGKIVVNIIDSGQNLWEQTIAAAAGTTELERIVDIDSQTIVFGGIVYAVSFNGTLAALELRTGRTIWKREYKAYRRMSLDGNTLFVVDEQSQVYALDRRNGVELWSQAGLRGRSLTGATPVKDYVVVGDKFGYLHWLEQESGEIVARYSVGSNDENDAIFSAPVADSDILYATTRDGQIVSIETP